MLQLRTMPSSRWPAVLVAAFSLTIALSAAAPQAADDKQPEQKIFTQKPAVAASQVRGERQTGKIAPTAPSENAQFADGPRPEWIWGADDNINYFLRKQFAGGSKSAQLIASADNQMTVFLNGEKVASGSEWSSPVRADVQKHIKPDGNVLLVQAVNQGGQAGLVLKLVLTMPDGSKKYVVSDKSWQAAEKKEADNWLAVKSHGELGVKPWGDVFAGAPKPAGLLPDIPRDVFNVLPGFQVELLYTVPKETQGSWVSITFDRKGRLIACDQQDKGLFRITPPPIGSEGVATVEKLDAKITAAQGMLDAFGSLYLSVNGGPGSGLYRARDTNGDDQYDEVTRLTSFRGGGEHGPHALRLAPDGKSIYIVCGNHTDPPDHIDASRIPTNWDEDLLLPRQWDARGHARGRLAPGGWVASTDPDGKTWEIFSIGYRNSYDMAFNADGELFVYDADMEWDLGSPWYRPTRVVHAASGSEFGWRSGTGKWPADYIDSLPPAVDIGPGSPVGVEFGYGAKFPAKYQKALYILDWTFGTMYAIHLEPNGSSYTATKEEFVSRTPLPLTDAAVGPDGALYFTIGGRGTQSELYRVTYVGDESTEPVDARNAKFADLRELRHKLEHFHSATKNPTAAVEFIWPNLKHADRFIRYAARVALEQQETAKWQDRVFAENDADTLIAAAVALARQGDKSIQPRLVEALDRLDFKSLSEKQRLDLLRAYSLVFIRMGDPGQAAAAALAARLDPFYPADSDSLNRELSQMLVYLKSPTVIAKTLKLIGQQSKPTQSQIDELLARNAQYGGTIAQMLANQPELQKIHYAFVLRNLRYGWTLDQRKQYFEWLAEARNRSGGASYQGFIDNIRKEALENASEAERQAIAAAVVITPINKEELPKPKGPGKEWSLDELVALTADGLYGRNFNEGKRAYAAARCIVCHRFDGEGGATGPDLTSVAGRFSYKDLGESLVDPGKVISDQYRASTIAMADGKVHTGRIVSETKTTITVLVDPEDVNKVVELHRDDIDDITPSKVSLMPKDLLKTLNQDEVLDMLAYLMSRGNPNDRMFQPRRTTAAK